MTKITIFSLMAGVFVLGGAPVVLAQLTAASKGPVVYGHHHLNVTSIDEHKKFLEESFAEQWGWESR